MIREIRAVFARSADTALEDAMGALCLFALLGLGLCLPGLV